MRLVGAAGPHLLAGYEPIVIFPGGECRDTGQVGTGSWLTEQLAPVILAGEDAAQKSRLLVRLSNAVERRGHLVNRYEVGASGRCADLGEYPIDLALETRVLPEPAVAGLEVNPGQPEIELCAQERSRIRLRGPWKQPEEFGNGSIHHVDAAGP
ncbi:hypothetical protein [Haloechinothrix aidingensis]|uniref:hypothetical protein n=1 Tax=Haloechinothrix aidingensis TaxID=2752311 RepID=UPI001FEB16C4|nr:hypothetical protein [Haloechinothrix aidingensis]